jgi:signal transduction histidine kinase
LAAGLAHEINNPLAAVLGSLELVQMEVARLGAAVTPGDRAQQGELLDVSTLAADVREARSAAERIRVLSRDVCSFARYDDETPRSVTVSEVLESAVALALPQIRARAQLVKEYRSVPLVHGSASQMEQVFLNLLVNAAQAIPPGHLADNEIRLVIRADDKAVAVEVRDTGCGMTFETQQRVFEPFFTTKPVGIGTGMGLYLARHLCREMSGDIEVSSLWGKGTTFVVTLPVASRRLEDSGGTIGPGEPLTSGDTQ